MYQQNCKCADCCAQVVIINNNNNNNSNENKCKEKFTCEPKIIKPEKICIPHLSIPRNIPNTVSASGKALVVCSEKTAGAIALQIIQNGGNAFDAAIGAMAVLSVTRPGNCGIGGGGFATLYQACSKKIYFINGREKAPRSARSTMFQDSNGIQLPFNVAISTGSSVGVPGTVALMEQITKFGRVRSWNSLFKPAINIAKNGYTVDTAFNNLVLQNVWKLQNYNYSKNLFLSGPGNTPLPVGSLFKNLDYANTLKELAEHGAQYFYDGPIGLDIVNAVQNFSSLKSLSFSYSNSFLPYSFNNPTPSLSNNYLNINSNAMMTLDDLQAFTAPLGEPVSFTYKGNKLFSSAPPSSGGLTIAAILKSLEPYNVGSLPLADAYAYFINATSAALADRAAYMGDAEYVNVPIVGLLSNQYLASRSALLVSTGNSAPFSAGNPFAYQPLSVSGVGINLPSCKYEQKQLKDTSVEKPLGNAKLDIYSDDNDKPIGATTNITIADFEGNIIDVTFTNEQFFGTGASVPGRGFILNNELTDFNFGGFTANYPTKRITGNVISGSNIVTSIPSTSGIIVGQYIYNNNVTSSSMPIFSFPNGTTVVSIDSPTQITVSNPATMSGNYITFIITNTTVTAGSYSPGGANEVASFRRPRSSMSPTIVLDSNNNPIISTGAAGGAAIIPTVAQNLLQMLEFKYSAVQSNNATRFISSNTTSTNIAPGSDIDTAANLITALNAKSPSFNIPAVVFTGSIIGNILTVTSIATGTFSIGLGIIGNGILDNTVITEFGTGTGGIGTYIINIPQSIQSETIIALATVQRYPSEATIITIDPSTNIKTGTAQDIFQARPTAPGFTPYAGSALSLLKKCIY
jgi:gamma-glutamyltranspeptidase/glutathione hydrolase